MTMERHVVITVTKEGGAVTRQGFGVPGFFNENTVQSTSARFNRYANIAEIVAAGFATTDQFYKWAQVVFSQQPAPQYVASCYWDEVGGPETIDAAIAAVELTNSADYYHAAVDTRTDTKIIAAATSFEALKKYYYAQTSDSDLLAGTAGNIGEDLRLAARDRTALVYNATDAEFSDGAMAGIGGAAQVDAPGGAITFKFKTLRGVTASTLNTTQLDNIDAENANYHITVGGRNILAEGTSASGEFIDVQHSLDWAYFRSMEAVFRALATTSTKVPYNNAGIAAVVAELEGVAQTGQENLHFDPEVAPIIQFPKKADIDPNDISSRLLPDIDLQVDIAGAIHKVTATIRVRV